jgi:D-lactate dehydrogenase (cytochrome)
VKEINQILGDDFVSFDEDDIEGHGHSDWSTSNTKVRPIAVVSPGTIEDVSKIAKICPQYRVPMVPFGAGSSVEGNFSSPHSGVCIDLSRMNKILSFHEDDMDVVEQPGVNWLNLNKSIEKSGLFLPLDPGPTAHIGGMVATNCSGTNAMRYGTMKDWVINLTVVLADGTIMKTRHRPRKTSAGYNLTALFTGSEGTLGIITEITLKLAVIPEKFSVSIVAFPTVRDAATAASRFMRDGVPMAALELMDETQMKIINQNGGAGGRFWSELPTLFLKSVLLHSLIPLFLLRHLQTCIERMWCGRFSGTQRSIDDDIARIKHIADTHKGGEFLVATTKDEMDNLWAARKEALWASLAVRPEGTQIWSTDVAVPLSKMAGIIGQKFVFRDEGLCKLTVFKELSKQESSNLGLFSSVLGHVGDGNFRQCVMYNPDKSEELKAVEDCVHRMMIRAIAMEGTVSVRQPVLSYNLLHSDVDNSHRVSMELDLGRRQVEDALKASSHKYNS